MEPQKKQAIEKQNQEDFAPSYLNLRKAIGWAVLLMPIIVRNGARIFEGISADSISAYYYTGMRDVFVATLVTGGVLLAAYRTPAWIDTVLAMVAGLAGIGVGLFPMEPVFAQEILQKFPGMDQQQCYIFRGLLGYHFYFVLTFFSLGFFLVFFRFNKFTPPTPSPKKLRRNTLYKLCGLVMLAAFVWIGILRHSNKDASIFLPETIALASFAAAWLIKGQLSLFGKFAYIKDDEPRSWTLETQGGRVS